MTDEKIAKVIAEAERFIASAKTLQRRRQKADLYEGQGCRESGSCRRASLDLTRALADLRKP